MKTFIVTQELRGINPESKPRAAVAAFLSRVEAENYAASISADLRPKIEEHEGPLNPAPLNLIGEIRTGGKQSHHRTTDPLENIIAHALDAAGIEYVTEAEGNPHRLDFFLPKHNLCIEVKAAHSERISQQAARHPNVIIVQGEQSALFLAQALKGMK